MTQQEKINQFKQYKNEYVTSKKPVLVDINRAFYLTVDGKGAPGDDEFTRKIGALYGMAYTIKMTRKFSGQQDYVVSKLEAQWWPDDAQGDFSAVPKEEWNWKLLIRTPDFVGRDEVTNARAALQEKGKGDGTDEVALEPMEEGLCVQMLHVGPYDREDETIAEMRAFVEDEGLSSHGLHHEIYISDPRRVPPERLKTILRHPVKSAGQRNK